MAITGLGPVHSIPFSSNNSIGVLEEIDDLIKNYESQLLDPYSIITIANLLIDELNASFEQNLPLAREGLCRLLKLNIEVVRIRVISSLKPLFHLHYLEKDMCNQSIESFLTLEKHVSEAVDSYLRTTGSVEITHPLLHLYNAILERLWIMRCLSQDSKDQLCLFEKHGFAVVFAANHPWISLLEKEARYDQTLHELLENLQAKWRGIVLLNQNLLMVKHEVFKYLGNAYASLEDYPKAIPYYKNCLEIAQSLKDKVEEATAYGNLGKSFFQHWQFLTRTYNSNELLTFFSTFIFHAVVNYQNQLLVLRELKESAQEATVYGKASNVYHIFIKSGNSSDEHDSQMLELHERQLKIANSFGDLEGELIACEVLGNYYPALITAGLSEGKYRQVIEYCEKYVQIAQFLNDRDREKRAYGGEKNARRFLSGYANMGIAYYFLSEYSLAIECFEKYLLFSQVLEDRQEERKAYGNLGNVYDSMGKYLLAIEYQKKCLHIAQSTKDLAGEGKAYGHLGNSHHSLREYHLAIQYHEKCLQIGLSIKDQAGEGKAYANLGNVYFSIYEYRRAIDYYNKSLKIVKSLNDRADEAGVYMSLGNAYMSLNEYRSAIEYLEKALKIAHDCQNHSVIGKIYMNLGNAYHFIGEHAQAIKCYEKGLQIVHTVEGQVGIIPTYGNMGVSYMSIGKYTQGGEYFEKQLQIAQAKEDRFGEMLAFGNLGNLRFSLQEYDQAIEYYIKQSRCASALEDRVQKANAYLNIGNFYRVTKEYGQAIAYYENYLQTVVDSGNRLGEESAYYSLGSVYYLLGEYHQALKYCIQSLQICQALEYREGEMKNLNAIGLIYAYLEDYHQSEEKFRACITLCSELQHKLGDNHQWKIPYFEGQARAYVGLEKILLKQRRIQEALAVTDFRRSRALVSLLTQKCVPHPSKPLLSTFLTSHDMQTYAEKFKTLFIIYSFASLEKDERNINIWMIPPIGDIIQQSVLIDALPEYMLGTLFESFQSTRGRHSQLRKRSSPIEEIKQDDSNESSIQTSFIEHISDWYAVFVKDTYRGSENESNTIEDKQKYVCSRWYQDYIAPIAQFLPQHGERVTIIPDGFLHDIPFALFQDGEGNYLFEKYTLTIIPSIETLIQIHDLDIHNKPHRNVQNISIIANPEPNQEYQLKALPGVRKEREVLAKLFQQISPSNDSPTVAEVKKRIVESGHIHFACHGLAEEQENAHSVFEGALVMTDQLLYAEDISGLPLNAELTFLSACDSGHGKIYREGSVGLPFAFLAGGASSVIATRWPIPDHATQDIVREFYQHYLGKSKAALQAQVEGRPFGQAEALREAMLFAKKKYPTKQKIWGAFFLTGLPGNIQHMQKPKLELQPIDLANAISDHQKISPIYTDRQTGNTFHFFIKESVIRVTFFKKGDKMGKEFLETEIQVQMTNLAQMKAGATQKIRLLSQLDREQKDSFIQSIPNRKWIKVNGKQILIGPEP